MRARLPSISIRLFVLIAVWLLGTATITLAQDTGTPSTAPDPAGSPAPAEQADPTQTAPVDPASTDVGDVPSEPLVVPDVRGLPYVFAKGVLEDAGFAWELTGKVEGYAVNLVVEQNVKPGVRVVDTGFPTLQLRLGKNDDYEARGLPENASPYAGTELLLASDAPATPLPAEPSESEPEEPADPGNSTVPATTGETTTEQAATTEPATTTEPAATTEPETADSTETSNETASSGEASAATKKRPPAFVVAGAPREPLDEIPLPLRAKRLKARLADEPRPTQKLVRFWQYQHAWIVTGAEFGWWHGAEALRILITVDEDLQRRWGMGAKSEAVARAALAEVLRRSR